MSGAMHPTARHHRCRPGQRQQTIYHPARRVHGVEIPPSLAKQSPSPIPQLKIETMPERRKLIAGNWKMNGLAPPGWNWRRIWRDGWRRRPGKLRHAGLPAGHARPCRRGSRGRHPLAVGGQDCHVIEVGCHTGDISAVMLADAGSTTSSSAIPSAGRTTAKTTRWFRPRRPPRMRQAGSRDRLRRRDAGAARGRQGARRGRIPGRGLDPGRRHRRQHRHRL